MAVPLLDNEFMKYWSRLTVVEKESLLTVAKNYVQAKHDEADANDLRKNLIAQERETYLQGKGTSYSWEQPYLAILNKSTLFPASCTKPPFFIKNAIPLIRIHISPLLLPRSYPYCQKPFYGPLITLNSVAFPLCITDYHGSQTD